MAFAIDYHRPAVFCSSINQTKEELNRNPDCINSVIDTTTGKPIGCKDQAGLCDDSATNLYCPSVCRGVVANEKFIDYLSCMQVNGELKMNCSIKDSSNNSLFSYNANGTINNLIKDIWSPDSNCSSYRAKCEACFKERYIQATAPYYINSELDQCYDLENYNKSFVSFITETDEVKNSYKIQEFNGYYGSLGELDRDTKCSDSSSDSSINQLSCNGYYKLTKEISTAENANIELLNILNENLDIFYNSAYSEKYKDISGIFNFSTFDTKSTYRNGEMLEVKLCSDIADNCELKPYIVKYDNQILNQSSAYNFDQSGFLTRILSVEDASARNQCSSNSCYDCTIQKNGIGNFIDSKYMCHTVGVKYDSSGNPIQDSRYNNDLIKNVRLGFKIKDPDSSLPSPYSDNIGSYSVKVELKKTTDFGADLIKSIIVPVLEYVDGKYAIVNGEEVKVKDSMFEYHYKNLIADYRYKLLLNTCLIMFVMFYGLGYVIGISKLNHIELIHRAIKIGIIYMFVGKYGWQWFQAIFVTGFKDGVDYLVFNMASVFDNSPELLSAIDKNYFRDKSVLFSSSDAILKMIFSDPVIFKILGLLTASLFGFVYLTILGYGLMLYIYAIANATLIYLTAQFFISILFLLAPIFFILLLFGPTKEIFDNWIKHTIGLSLQQVFVLITVALFNAILYEVIKSSLGYRVCWDEVWVINLGIIRFSLLSFWTVPAFAPREVVNIDLTTLNSQPLEGLPSLFKILSIWAIASLMKHFVTFSAEIGGKIGDLSEGGMSAVNLSKDVANSFGSSFDKIKNAVSKAGSFVHDKTVGRLGDKINDKLFDYGKDADARKAKESEENKKTDNKVRSLINAGDEAVKIAKEDYLQSKINLEKGVANTGELKEYQNMSQEKFNEGLSKIRSDAINDKFEQIRNKDPLLTDKDKKEEIKNILNEAQSGSVRN
ncbi:MAG: type IV secretion system protein, partial [Rickettsiales bacterium]|nr:type IV secretion system protein [Rickettsiales bacterium]